MKKPISTKAFIEARQNGATVIELSKQFGISTANVKEIVQTLNLPKRAKVKNYELIVDNQDETRNIEQQ